MQVLTIPVEMIIFQWGRECMRNNTASDNIGMGYRTMYNNTNGYSNIAIGNYALYDNSTGDDNVCIGEYSGTNTTGNYNTYVGTDAGYTGIGVSSNTYIG